jgi:hypothetical protein
LWTQKLKKKKKLRYRKTRHPTSVNIIVRDYLLKTQSSFKSGKFKNTSVRC